MLGKGRRQYQPQESYAPNQVLHPPELESVPSLFIASNNRRIPSGRSVHMTFVPWMDFVLSVVVVMATINLLAVLVVSRAHRD